MVSRNQASGSSHVLHDNGRVARDVFAHVTGNGTGVGIEASSGGETHDNAYGFALVKWFLSKYRFKG
jgi:hypothetical protein